MTLLEVWFVRQSLPDSPAACSLNQSRRCKRQSRGKPGLIQHGWFRSILREYLPEETKPSMPLHGCFKKGIYQRTRPFQRHVRRYIQWRSSGGVLPPEYSLI